MSGNDRISCGRSRTTSSFRSCPERRSSRERTFFAIWVEEIHHLDFSSDPNKFVNYVSRLRDPAATKVACIGFAPESVRNFY